MSDPFFSDDDLRIVNSCMSRAYAEWVEDCRDASNYVDLARRLNIAGLRATEALRAKRNRPARCVP